MKLLVKDLKKTIAMEPDCDYMWKYRGDKFFSVDIKWYNETTLQPLQVDIRFNKDYGNTLYLILCPYGYERETPRGAKKRAVDAINNYVEELKPQLIEKGIIEEDSE